LLVQTTGGLLHFQLFAMTGLFRNQQVAGSIPAGGSSNPLKNKPLAGFSKPLPRI
jgi:hypothetical protein